MARSDMQVRVNWMIGWPNCPEVEIDNVELKEFTYHEYVIGQKYSNTSFYVGFDDDRIFSSYMLKQWSSRIDGAMGGKLKMDDGRTIIIEGCWSSRTSVANTLLPEEDHIVECGIRPVGKKVCIQMGVRVSWLKDHLPEGTKLRKEVDKDGEIKYNIYPIEGSEIYNELMIKKPSLCRSQWIKRA